MSLTELCWFFGPSLGLFLLLVFACLRYERQLDLAHREVDSAMTGWGRTIQQLEISRGSLVICSERLETAVEMLAGKQVRETIVTPTIHEAVPGSGIYRSDADKWAFVCRGRKVWERDGPMPTQEEMKKMKPRLCP